MYKACAIGAAKLAVTEYVATVMPHTSEACYRRVLSHWKLCDCDRLFLTVRERMRCALYNRGDSTRLADYVA